MAACPSPSGGGSQTYTGQVTGTAQDSAGAKLPGVTVSASTTPVTTAETDSNGAFSFPVTHSGSLTFTLTMEKACYDAAPPKSITLTSNDPYDTGVTTLSLKPEPTEESERYTFTQKSDGSYKLTVKECVTTIPQSEFSTFDAPSAGITESPILQRLAAASGKSITVVLTEIELPSTLKTISKFSFWGNKAVTGNLTIPKNVDTIGDSAFYELSLFNIGGKNPSTIASSQAPTITFAPGSKLRTIGEGAFRGSGSKNPLVLPSGLETIGARAFRYFMTAFGDLVIPGSVSSIGERAFSAFEGINDGVTIRSANLAKVGTNSPLGNNLFGVPGSGVDPRGSTITTIKLPASVYTSYTPAELTAIFGSEVTAYQDLAGNPHP